MPGDRRAESKPLSLIYRKLSQEEMKGPDWADAASLSVSPLLSSFFMAWHICLKEDKCRCWLRRCFGYRRLFCQSDGLGREFSKGPPFFKLIWYYLFSCKLLRAFKSCWKMRRKAERMIKCLEELDWMLLQVRGMSPSPFACWTIQPGFVWEKNTSCHQHDSTQTSWWFIKAALVAMPFYTHLEIAVASICLLLAGWATACSSMFLLYKLAHKTGASSCKGCHYCSNSLWWPPFFGGRSSIFPSSMT